MSSVKPPSSVSTPSIDLPPSGASSSSKPSAGTAAAKPTASPEELAKALRDYQKLQSRLKPMLTGAAGLFAENVNFPAELLDPSNPINDPKYLHLLSAMLGLKDLEKFFASQEQKVEKDPREKNQEQEEPEDDESE